MEMIWAKHKQDLEDKRSIDTCMIKVMSMLERTLNFTHTGNAVVLSTRLMDQAWLLLGLLSDRFPALSDMFIAHRALSMGQVTVRQHEWPVEAETWQPMTSLKQAQQLTYGEAHYEHTRWMMWGDVITEIAQSARKATWAGQSHLTQDEYGHSLGTFFLAYEAKFMKISGNIHVTFGFSSHPLGHDDHMTKSFLLVHVGDWLPDATSRCLCWASQVIQLVWCPIWIIYRYPQRQWSLHTPPRTQCSGTCLMGYLLNAWCSFPLGCELIWQLLMFRDNIPYPMHDMALMGLFDQLDGLDGVAMRCLSTIQHQFSSISTPSPSILLLKSSPMPPNVSWMSCPPPGPPDRLDEFALSPCCFSAGVLLQELFPSTPIRMLYDPDLEVKYNTDPTSLVLFAIEHLDIRKDREEVSECFIGTAGLGQLYLEAGLLHLEGAASVVLSASYATLSLICVPMQPQPENGAEAWQQDRDAASRYFDHERVKDKLIFIDNVKGKDNMDNAWYLYVPSLVGVGTALLVIGAIGALSLSSWRWNQGS
ncbi:hypothetical protein EDC04DRAFT_3090907 [Pisolithus marmoratus]|nr:hypothetical protein EDC04DRAFT_3090907 [Pisolithus marmoratus]